MYSFASILLGIAFICSIAAGGFLVFRLAADNDDSLHISNWWMHSLNIPITLCMTLASAILLYAFISYDFTVEYVYNYSDLTLPLFYRITAFWAGQPGSLLFWAWAVAISGVAFAMLPAYRELSTRTKAWYWVFFFAVIAFFLLLILVWSNPFITVNGTPQDGRGLNPLLQNPGMIFHPPLLFLGYGGFVVPGCLALAQTLSGRLYPHPDKALRETGWEQASRPFILLAWSLLTAGIVLGAWWAYMELGWGGYWAWDPVENASLLPWLIASAYLHTAVIGSRRGKLHRTNAFLMALTTISAFFATYLVRSGVVQSLHAFSPDSVGNPLVVFTLLSLYLTAFVCLCTPAGFLDEKKGKSALVHGALAGVMLLVLIFMVFMDIEWHLVPFVLLFVELGIFIYFSGYINTPDKPLEDLTSKEGLLLVVAWLLLAISFIILVATLWPVILTALGNISDYLPSSLAALIPAKPMGLEPAFYNRACLPLFAAFAVLLVICPFRKWKIREGKGGFYQPRMLLATLGCLVVVAASLWDLKITNPVALVAAACSVAAIMGILFFFSGKPSLLWVRSTMTAHGVHIGLLLTILGVAFSGPYQVQSTIELTKGEAAKVGNYTVVFKNLYDGESQIGPTGKPNYYFVEAELLLYNSDQRLIGTLEPQRRLYSNFDRQPFSEVSTHFSLGNEVYATLLGVDLKDINKPRASFVVHINPLVNWLWIGGTLMCLFPLFSFRRVTASREDEADDADNGAPQPSAL